MALVAAILASFIFGGGLVALVMQRRWRNEVESAKKSVQEMVEQANAIEDENRDLKQTNADLQYQLGEAKKDIQYLKNQSK